MKTGLAAKAPALMLSHQIMGMEFNFTSNSENKLFSQANSVAVLAKALYSASVEDSATSFYLRELHCTRLGPRYTQYPLVDLLSSKLLPQSTSA